MLRLVAVLFVLAPLLSAQSPEPLDTLRKSHPRLIALEPDITRIRRLVKTDPGAREIYESLVREARALAGAPTVEYKIAGPRLLQQSRLCLQRVYTLALLFRLDGDRYYRDRAVKELRAAAYFPDWNPSHFLDTAEMTHAFAIGYDWLYHSLTPEERAWIRRALIDKGLDPAIAVYEKQRGWPTSRFNWNQVCNGGIGIGALAVAGDEPQRANKVLRYALRSLPLAMASYAPDGGWAEGPGYWHYATRYTVYFLAALRSALGTDFGFSTAQGFNLAGHFRIFSSGPFGKSFNYADAGDRVEPASEMFWLSRRFARSEYAWQQRQLIRQSGRGDALDLVWYRDGAQSPGEAGWPLNAIFQGVQVAFLRSSWDNPNAIFVGVKGGDNKTNHGHLDLGAFVMDAGRVRWALDLGPDNYNLPGYFGKQRWTYYRLRTESHNVVLIDGQNQDPAASAAIVAHHAQPGLSWVRIDLSRAYPGKVKRMERTVALVQRRHVMVRDVVQAAQPVEALWRMVTDADVTVEGATAELRKSGWILSARIRSPRDAEFAVVPTAPPQPQAQNEGTKKLVVRLPEKVSSSTIEVWLTPYAASRPKPPLPARPRI